MEVQVESTNTTAEQSSEEMTQLVQEAEDPLTGQQPVVRRDKCIVLTQCEEGSPAHRPLLV